MGFADEIEVKVRATQSLNDQMARSYQFKDARVQLQQLQAALIAITIKLWADSNDRSLQCDTDQ